ncbi:2,4'-dihydroxyacetophenone dioxygenase family protein [Pseudonocardia abyssalis]|uniref:2,4'-dihydroxyacetophenone dioxygenase family protein n=1 Tax=Pseudonocardia abyssalis TaxID=2792008 RepID=A0ABS6URI1_9PSEU|nr:2,4'-dihydroxyacetophenone dioxygenase family protein [Pseudonocardia abyssalis]MBW0114297.1 2,4'-dihydroxyacetophenone dioxygenase family protein [Pseudonocardia abyssalis]MBW0134859.1 2,4'-dihydroxyacetophenone dioxygenase family protein [Pseudonocardia abyssalis]
MTSLLQTDLISLAQTVLDHQVEDSYLAADEVDSPWMPYGSPQVLTRYLSFDPRNGRTHALLKSTVSGAVGTHRHRGQVTAYTLSGSWGYLEYDWVSRAGDFVEEYPGAVHTLYTENGFEGFFVINGSLEYVDEEGAVVDTHDVFWFIDHYLRHCKENGLPVNKALFRS